MIFLRIYGRFRLTGPEGEDLLPRAMKARGLIALLALAPDYSRSRRWLQDKLWSDRDTQQGSDSLRQTLTIIRRSLGKHAHVLRADREQVSFDPAHFTVDREYGPTTRSCEADRGLFCGLDVADPEFESWVRDQRSQAEAVVEPSCFATRRLMPEAAPAIFFQCRTNVSSGDRLVRTIISLTTSALLDFTDFSIYHELGSDPANAGRSAKKGLIVALAAFGSRDRLELHVALKNFQGSEILLMQNFSICRKEEVLEQGDIELASSSIVDAILNTMKKRLEKLDISDCATTFANRARNLVFRFDKAALLSADRYFQAAYELAPKPQYLAWRAFGRTIAQFQHRTPELPGDNVSVDALFHEAISEAPDSATVLGIGAHIEYLRGGSPRNSLSLAKRAIKYDPLNSVNLAILSNTELILGDLRSSRASSLAALQLTGGSEARAFTEFFCCMSAAALGEYEDATNHAEAALLLRPSFVAPLRYLITLHKQAGRTASYDRSVSRMRVLETGFTPARMLDSDYPVTTLRRLRLFDTLVS
ncbi:hypothetical protein ACQZ6F_27090 [Rhizobium sp. A22-96]